MIASPGAGDVQVLRPGSSRTLVMLVVASALLLGMTLALAGSLALHTRSLEKSVQTMEATVNANVRTIGQVQRELLRVTAALQGDVDDLETLERYRAFVSQRMREVTLTYQLNTLGTEELLAEATALAERWFEDVEPSINRIVAGDESQGVRQQALAAISQIERGFNELASRGEINRKRQAAEAHEATVAMLADAGLLVGGIGAAFLGFLTLVTAFVVRFRRLEGQREVASRRLVALNEELSTLSEVANRTGNMVVITDRTGRIEWVNESFVARTGYSLADASGRTPGDLLQGPGTDPATVDFMRDRLRAHGSFITEVLNYTRRGEAYWVRLDVRPVLDPAGQLTGFVAVQTDITEQREAQDLLLRAKEAAEQTAEEKTQFLASMSHEIRTPLNAVIGITDLLLETDLDDEQRELVATARRSGALLLGTIDDILSFSAAEAGSIQLEERALEPRALVREIVAMLRPQAEAKGLDLEATVTDTVPAAWRGDELRLRQVVTNLLANAVKFTDSGRVQLRVDAMPVGDGRHRVSMSVRDDGIGIPPERLASVFEPFTQADASTTRRFGGSGLGLAITQRIVNLMGGTIDVESTEGMGSEFVVTIEVAADERPAARHTATVSDGGATRSLRVLVAEDDSVNRMVIERMLQRLGHDVSIAVDGVEAVAAAAAGRYDVVLMDVQMPRLDGIGAARRIRAELAPDRQPFIVALTASALAGDRERLLVDGMDGYLSKPLRLADLRDLLQAVVVDRASDEEVTGHGRHT